MHFVIWIQHAVSRKYVVNLFNLLNRRKLYLTFDYSIQQNYPYDVYFNSSWLTWTWLQTMYQSHLAPVASHLLRNFQILIQTILSKLEHHLCQFKSQNINLSLPAQKCVPKSHYYVCGCLRPFFELKLYHLSYPKVQILFFVSSLR